jgi:prevent-host-death family protein
MPAAMWIDAMKSIDIGEASSPLAEYVRQARAEPLILTDHGAPTAVLLSLPNADLETVSLSTNPAFLALIERSRAPRRGRRSLRCRDASSCSFGDADLIILITR